MPCWTFSGVLAFSCSIIFPRMTGADQGRHLQSLSSGEYQFTPFMFVSDGRHMAHHMMRAELCEFLPHGCLLTILQHCRFCAFPSTCARKILDYVEAAPQSWKANGEMAEWFNAHAWKA
jgi:hypothetical protein